MTTPPEETSSARAGSYGRGGGAGEPLTRIGWNAVLLVAAAAGLLIAIIALFVADVRGAHVVTSVTVLTAAYLISRGIAKASRVYEP